MLLAGLGIYGVLAYAVGARTRDIGIRTALGARSGDAARLVVRQSLGLVAIGLALGLLMASVEGRVLQSQLFAVASFDAMWLLLAHTVLVVVALLAAYLPARRALAVHPVDALRGKGQ